MQWYWEGAGGWALRGYFDPEGEFEGGEIVCVIEQSEDGYQT